MLSPDDRPLLASEVAHVCKMCKKPLHSYILCSAVWMPVENQYFCSKLCLLQSNAAAIRAVREEGEDDTFGPDAPEWDDWLQDNPGSWFPLRQRPDAEVQENLNDSGDDDSSANGSANGSAIANGDEAAEIADAEATAETETPRGEEQGGATTSGATHAEALALVSPGNRVQESFLLEDAPEGKWFGGVIGDIEPDGRIIIGFDDGDLRLCSVDEIVYLYSNGKLCACTTNSGLLASEPSQTKAAALCVMKSGEVKYPIGVLMHGPGADRPSILRLDANRNCSHQRHLIDAWASDIRNGYLPAAAI